MDLEKTAQVADGAMVEASDGRLRAAEPGGDLGRCPLLEVDPPEDLSILLVEAFDGRQEGRPHLLADEPAEDRGRSSRRLDIPCRRVGRGRQSVRWSRTNGMRRNRIVRSNQASTWRDGRPETSARRRTAISSVSCIRSEAARIGRRRGLISLRAVPQRRFVAGEVRVRPTLFVLVDVRGNDWDASMESFQVRPNPSYPSPKGRLFVR